ncbi:MAG: 50S ribosomal protein L6 [Fibrobacteres bacterium]|nr:50S ribosomal protein L6 [Fibrobacterota bacterium]
MSRIGKLPIEVPASVKVKFDGSSIHVEGPKGKLSQKIDGVGKLVNISVEGNTVTVTRLSEENVANARHGLYRALIASMVKGVSEGYEKILDVQGVGYKAAMKGKGVEVLVGYSHPVTIQPMHNTVIALEGNTRIKVSGPDKYAVGQVAATIRKVKKPEPYKGKGIRYAGENVRKKAGKTNAS